MKHHPRKEETANQTSVTKCALCDDRDEAKLDYGSCSGEKWHDLLSLTSCRKLPPFAGEQNSGLTVLSVCTKQFCLPKLARLNIYLH